SARLKPWPWPGAVVLPEVHEASGRAAFHVVDHWCYLGSVETRDEVAAVLDSVQPRFELDTYRILSRWLGAAENLASAEPL
ncbi:MAG: ethanolamine utilization protein, partial [Betaproteobacteria bacterium HGW-Betaproteobacteria-21]